MADIKVTNWQALSVELNITPEWWGVHGGRAISPKSKGASERIALAMMMAVDLFPNGAMEVRASRAHLKVVVVVPPDMAPQTLHERVAEMVQKLNALVLEP